MRKKYVQPTFSVTDIEPENMFAASGININGDSGSGKLNDGNATGDALSHGYYWDDDEE